MESTPKISKVHWVDASGVLGHEERGFSVWLSQNLDLLADALELPDLTLVQRELRVETFRADILAMADDGSDDGLPVIIENQYGVTNHDHLGKVVTYLAGQQRGWGVWVVERFNQAHVAAIEFSTGQATSPSAMRSSASALLPPRTDITSTFRSQHAPTSG